MKTPLLLATCAAALAAMPAQAALVTLTYDLTGANFLHSFAPNGPAAAPVDPLQLNFTLTFDTGVDTADGITDGLTVTSFNLPYALRYTYLASSDTLIIGTDPIPYGACTTFSINADHFCAFIDNAATASASVGYDDYYGTYYLSLGTPTGGQWDAQTASLAVGTAAVPEPATWAMMIAGFALTGAALRRRRAATTVRFA